MSNPIYNQINDIIKQFSSNREIVKIFDGGDRYLILTSLIGMKQDYINPDPYYAISKKTMNIVFFSPMAESKWFIETKKHPIYIKEN